MNAIDRVTAIGQRKPVEKWRREDFLYAAKRAKDRWHATEELFEIRYEMLRDAVLEIDPKFDLSDDQVGAITNANLPQVYLLRRISVSFVRWEMCHATTGFPNPYDPLIEIWEHGGDIQQEHGQFLDLYDDAGLPAGGMFICRA